VPWDSLSGPILPPHSNWPVGEGLSYGDLKDILSTTPDPKKAKEWSQFYTAGPHLAGQNLSQAVWTKERWEEFGVKSEVVPYEVYINYPLDHRLALLKDGEVSFEATLEEDVLEEDPTSGSEDRVPTFHGYSASGNVTAQYVYCNYGTFIDFENLLEAGVELKGKIALVRYGAIFRGLKVKRAQELGMVGTIIYSDPGDDGLVTEVNGYKPYPEGPARNPSSVQRGSVQYLSELLHENVLHKSLTSCVQVNSLVTLLLLDTPRSLVCLAKPRMHRLPQFRRCQSLTPKPFPCSRH